MKQSKSPDLKHDLGRGEIKSNAMAAVVTSQLFQARTHKSLKGKGSYTRKAKNNRKGLDSYHKPAFLSCFMIRILAI